MSILWKHMEKEILQLGLHQANANCTSWHYNCVVQHYIVFNNKMSEIRCRYTVGYSSLHKPLFFLLNGSTPILFLYLVHVYTCSS